MKILCRFRIAMVIALIALSSGCSETRKTADEVTKEVTGYNAIQKSKELTTELRQTQQERQQDLEEAGQ